MDSFMTDSGATYRPESAGQFGRSLKSLLKARGLSQREFAKRSGLDPGYVSKLVNGKIEEPRREAIEAIAQTLGLTVDELWATVDSPEAVTAVIEPVGGGGDSTVEFQEPKRFVGDRLLDVPVWVGRDVLLGQLRDRLLQPSLKVLALIGQGGIGKTSLAAKLVESIGVDLGQGEVLATCAFDGILLLESRGTGDLVTKIFDGLGLKAEGLEPPKRLKAIFQVLQRQSWLLVLDNLEDLLLPSDDERAGQASAPEVGALLNGLVYRNHRSQVLLTSRELPRDLAEQRGQNWRPNPKLVRVEVVTGISKEAGASLLRDFGVVDDQAKLEEISARVAGHVFVLTQLAAFAVSELDGRLYRYLQQHPELYTDDVSQILMVQLGRRTEAQQQLLKRMAVLQFLTDVQGLTFLRLYADEWETDGRLLINDDLPMPFSKIEQAETQSLIDELVRVSLVEKVLEPVAQVRQYRLHPVVTEFLQKWFSEELPAFLQRVQVFYQSAQQPFPEEFMQVLQLIQIPLLAAQHLGHQEEHLYLGLRLMSLMNNNMMMQAGEQIWMSLMDNNMMTQTWEQIASSQGLDELDILLYQGELGYQFKTLLNRSMNHILESRHSNWGQGIASSS
jgi:transcriptional regulator with XRE-family HTH domain